MSFAWETTVEDVQNVLKRMGLSTETFKKED